MTLIIKGSGLTIEDVVKVARQNEKVELNLNSGQTLILIKSAESESNVINYILLKISV